MRKRKKTYSLLALSVHSCKPRLNTVAFCLKLSTALTSFISCFCCRAAGLNHQQLGGQLCCYMKPYAERFYKSTAWKNCSQVYLHRQGYLCEECLKRGLHTPATLVHHIVHISPENIGDPSVTLNFDNLEALCVDCHAAIHSGSERRRYRLDDMGRVLPR